MMNSLSRSLSRLALSLCAVAVLAGCQQDASDDMPNRPPTIGGVPGVLTDAGTAYNFAPRASDEPLVFFATGFETTAVATAAAVLGNPPANFFVLSAHKYIPPVMEIVAEMPDTRVEGFLAAGHAAAITGWGVFERFVEPMGDIRRTTPVRRRVVVGGIVERGELRAEGSVQIVVERRSWGGAVDELGQGERPWSLRCVEDAEKVTGRQRTNCWNEQSGGPQMRPKPCLPTDFVRIAAVVAVQLEDVAGVAGGEFVDLVHQRSEQRAPGEAEAVAAGQVSAQSVRVGQRSHRRDHDTDPRSRVHWQV